MPNARHRRDEMRVSKRLDGFGSVKAWSPSDELEASKGGVGRIKGALLNPNIRKPSTASVSSATGSTRSGVQAAVSMSQGWVFLSENYTNIKAHIGSTAILPCQVKKDSLYGMVRTFPSPLEKSRQFLLLACHVKKSLLLRLCHGTDRVELSYCYGSAVH